MKTNKDALEGLTEEVRAKVVACKTEEELQSLLDDQGVEIGEELLGEIAGGRRNTCPYLFDTGIVRK